jgi:uncharacterized lipoprotein YbaY
MSYRAFPWALLAAIGLAGCNAQHPSTAIPAPAIHVGTQLAAEQVLSRTWTQPHRCSIHR